MDQFEEFMPEELAEEEGLEAALLEEAPAKKGEDEPEIEAEELI